MTCNHSWKPLNSKRKYSLFKYRIKHTSDKLRPVALLLTAGMAPTFIHRVKIVARLSTKGLTINQEVSKKPTNKLVPSISSPRILKIQWSWLVKSANTKKVVLKKTFVKTTVIRKRGKLATKNRLLSS